VQLVVRMCVAISRHYAVVIDEKCLKRLSNFKRISGVQQKSVGDSTGSSGNAFSAQR